MKSASQFGEKNWVESGIVSGTPQALPPLSVTILKLLREHERLTIAELEQLIEATRNTLRVRLRELTQGQQITNMGRRERHGILGKSWSQVNNYWGTFTLWKRKAHCLKKQSPMNG